MMNKIYTICCACLLLYAPHFLWGQMRNEAKNTIPAAIQAEMNEPVIQKMYQKGGAFETFDMRTEDVSKRDAFTKHFPTGDGHYAAVVGAGHVHYNENGAWLTIATDIMPNNSGKNTQYSYYNKWNSFKTFYGANPTQGILIQKGNESTKLWQNPEMAWLDAAGSQISVVKAQANAVVGLNKQEITYKKVFNNIDAVAIQNVTGIETHYLIQAAQTAPANAKYLAFGEKMTLPTGWKVVGKKAKGAYFQQIGVYNGANVLVGIYDVPRFWDSGKGVYGENPQTNDKATGVFSFSQNGNEIALYTLVETAWVNSPERSYPITIDPTYTAYPDNATWYTQTADDCGGNQSDLMKIGFDNGSGLFSGTSDCFMQCAARFNLNGIPDHVPGVTTTVICSTTVNLHYIGNDVPDNASCGATYEGGFRVGRVDVNLITQFPYNAIETLHPYPDPNFPATWTWGAQGNTFFPNLTANGNNWFRASCGIPGNKDVSDSLTANYVSIGFDNISGHGNPGFQLFCCFCTPDDDDWIQFDGHTSVNKPYLTIEYYVVPEYTVFGNGNDNNATNDWYVYGFNGNDVTLNPSLVQYRGYYQSSGLNITTSNAWGVAASPSAAVLGATNTAWQGCTVNNDNHTVVHKRRGFPCGQYQATITGFNGTAQVSVNGGAFQNVAAAPFTFWSDTLTQYSTVEIRHAAGAGNSSLTVVFDRIDNWKADAGTDVSLCSGDTLFLLGNISGLGGSGTPATPPCTNTNPPNCAVTYEWLGPNLSPNPSPFQNVTLMNVTSSASYYLTVTSAIGCQSKDTISASILSAPIINVTAVPNPICSGGTTSIALNSNQPGVTYNWTRNNTFFVSGTAGQNGVSAPINLTLTNTTNQPQQVDVMITALKNGCEYPQAPISIGIQPVPEIAALMVSNNPLCSGQQAQIIPSSTNFSGLTYTWTFAAANPGALVGSPVAAGVSGTQINVALLNQSGVTENGTFTFSASSPNSCPVPSITVPVTVNPKPVASIAAAGPTAFCQGGNVTLNALPSSGVSYLWSNSLTTSSINVNTAGTYWLVVTNTSFCKDTAIADVVVNPNPPISNITAIGPTTFCAGDTSVVLDANIGNNYTYNWSPANPAPGSPLYYVTQSNVYAVTVTNPVTGCSTALAPVPVVINPNPSATLFASNGAVNYVCADPLTDLVVTAVNGTANYNYQWTAVANGTTTITIPYPGQNYSPATLPPGATGTTIYSVEVTDANGCHTTTNPFTVNPTPSASIQTIFTPATFCTGLDSIILNAAGAGNGTYNWGAVAPTPLTNLSQSGSFAYIVGSGQYFVIATNPEGCSDSAYSEVFNFNAPPAVSIQLAAGDDNAICQNETLVLYAQPSGANYSYEWSLDGQLLGGANADSLVVNAEGTYQVAILDLGTQCPGIATQNVVVNDTLETHIVASNSNLSFCENQSITLTAPQNTTVSSYQWYMNGVPVYTGNPLVITANNFVAPGNVSLGLVTTGGCTSSDAVNVVMNPLPVATISPAGSIGLCEGETLTLQASGGNGYNWTHNGAPYSQTQSITITANSNGNWDGIYGLTAISTTGCQSTSQAQVELFAKPQPYGEIYAAGDVNICRGNSVPLNAIQTTGNFVWIKDGDTIPNSYNVNPLNVTLPGVYNIMVSNDCGTFLTGTPITVTESQPITASFTYAPQVVHPNELVYFTNQSAGGNLGSWEFGDGGQSTSFNAVHGYQTPGTYAVYLSVADQYGCNDDTTQMLVVVEWGNPFIPDIFTPNGDGTFDMWEIYYADLQGISTSVFDRWGVPVFETLNPNNLWDGNKATGQACPAGVYYYIITASKPSGEKVTLKGNVTLMR